MQCHPVVSGIATHQEASAAVLEAEHREAPKVSQAYGVAEARDEEVEGIVPVAAVLSRPIGGRVAPCRPTWRENREYCHLNLDFKTSFHPRDQATSTKGALSTWSSRLLAARNAGLDPIL